MWLIVYNLSWALLINTYSYTDNYYNVFMKYNILAGVYSIQVSIFKYKYINIEFGYSIHK